MILDAYNVVAKSKGWNDEESTKESKPTTLATALHSSTAPKKKKVWFTISWRGFVAFDCVELFMVYQIL